METEVKRDIPKTGAEPITGAEPAQTLSKEDVEKIVSTRVQSETDRVRTELYGKIKAKDTEIEELKKTTMSAAEIRKMQEEKLTEREKELQQKELVIVATDSLRDSNLPIDFRDIVIGETAEQTKANILLLAKQFQKAVEAAVAEKFRATGHEPAKGEPAKGRRIYTRSEIKAMSKEEYARHAADLQLAMKDGRIKPG